jgi:hypothetical protein
MTKCIQKQLKFHTLAREAALRGLKAADEGKRKEAIAAQVEAERYVRMYRKYGGTRPIT